MRYTTKIQKAIDLAAKAHQGQKRKGIKVPYVTHPYAAAIIVSQYTDDEDILTAALLHDLLEDTNVTRTRLEREFGASVARMVNDVTEEPHLKASGMSWKERKDHCLEKLKQAPPDSLMIASADKIQNLHSMCEAFDLMGLDLWKIFKTGPEPKLGYYGRVCLVARQKLANGIVDEFQEALERAAEKTAPHFTLPEDLAAD